MGQVNPLSTALETYLGHQSSHMQWGLPGLATIMLQRCLSFSSLKVFFFVFSSVHKLLCQPCPATELASDQCRMDGRQQPSEPAVEHMPAPTSDNSDPTTLRSPGGYRRGSADLPDRERSGENVVDHGGGLEDAGSRAEMHSPIPDFWAAKTPPMEQFPQYYREDARKPPVRDTIISGTSGITGSSGTTAGSGTPMLPSIPRSAFDEDTPKPKKKLLLCGIKRSNFYVLLVLLLFILVAGVAIGVGVGMSTTSGASPYSKQTNPSRRALYNPRDRRRHE